MEFVYVVARSELFERECPKGFEPLPTGELTDRFLRPIAERGFFVERRRAEQDPTLKQVIPYCVVVCRGEVLSLRRHKTQGEARLHDKLSIGIGGHLEPVDAEPRCGVLAAGAARELEEELHGADARLAAVGVLNDDSNAVGAVHFGIVLVADCATRPVVRETDRMTGSWSPWADLRESASQGANFESWSALVLRTWAPSEFHEVVSSLSSSSFLPVPDAIGSHH
jgi:predicted NUDIX family phosphoesterase